MNESHVAEIDFIKELRLRRWARRHYVAAEAREASWHPVVLDEMRRRDRELERHVKARDTICAVYVPLLPQPSGRLDTAHTAGHHPARLAAPEPVESEIVI